MNWLKWNGAARLTAEKQAAHWIESSPTWFVVVASAVAHFPADNRIFKLTVCLAFHSSQRPHFVFLEFAQAAFVVSLCQSSVVVVVLVGSGPSLSAAR